MIFYYLSIIFILIFFFIYLFYLLKFNKHFKMENNIGYCHPQRVSIIICARNEEMNIRRVLDALLVQDYDYSFLEIIIANDQSTDKTGEILKEYCDKHSFIKSFTVINRDLVKSPKKNAVKQAINIALGEIILLTDADCLPTKNWIKSHISMYDKYPETDMVVGFTKTDTSNDGLRINNDHIKPLPLKLSLLKYKFEHIDFLILMFAAQGAIQAGHPFSCSGQNLSYKKESFLSVQGFDNIDKFISGDDLLLMQKFVKNKKTIKFASYAEAYTVTLPVNSWRELINQRARWASNLKVMPKMNTNFFIYLLSCFICIGLLPFFAIYIYIIKIFIDDLYLRHALNDWGLKYKFIDIFWWYIISPFYILLVTLLGIFSVFKWKDRRA